MQSHNCVMNNYATFAALNGCPKAMKWAYLVNLSTTTNMTFIPWDFGKPVMKSIEIEFHALSGIGRG